jgi:hypothetical protein
VYLVIKQARMKGFRLLPHVAWGRSFERGMVTWRTKADKAVGHHVKQQTPKDMSHRKKTPLTAYGQLLQSVHRRSWSEQKIRQAEINCGSDVSAWMELLRKLVKQGKPYPIVRLLERMEESDIIVFKPEHIEIMVEACVTARDSQQAYEIITKYTDDDSDSKTKGRVGSGVIEQDYKLQPLSGQSASRDVNRRRYRYQVSPRAYQLALTACGVTGDVNALNKLLTLMERRQIPLSLDNWNSVLNAVSIFSLACRRTHTYAWSTHL